MSKFAIKTVITADDKASAKVGKVARQMTAGLGGGLRRLRGMAGGVAKTLGSIATPLGLGLGGLGLAGGVAGVLGAVKAHAAAGDEIAKFSRQVGLGSEALQELDYAANRSGVSQQLLRMSLRQLNRRVGELRGGYGSLKGFLEKVSPALLEQVQSARNTDEAFDLAVRAISRVADPAKKAALAAQFFGEEGAGLTRMAEGGVAGLRKLREEARRFGLMSDQVAADAEKFADTTYDATQAVVGLRTAVGSRLLPILTPMVDRLTEWVTANRELVALKVEGVITGIADAIKGTDWGKVGADIATIGGAIGTITSVSAEGIRAIGGIETATIALGTAAAVAALPFAKLAATAAAVGGAWEAGGAIGDWLASITGASIGTRAGLVPEGDARMGVTQLRDGKIVPLSMESDATAALRRQSAPDAPPALLPLTFAGGHDQRVGGEVRVTIMGPAGTRVDRVVSANPDVPIEARVGRRLVGGLEMQ